VSAYFGVTRNLGRAWVEIAVAPYVDQPQRSYHKLIYFHEVDKGGHFAAREQPELFAAELRAAFRSLR